MDVLGGIRCLPRVNRCGHGPSRSTGCAIGVIALLREYAEEEVHDAKKVVGKGDQLPDFQFGSHVEPSIRQVCYLLVHPLPSTPELWGRWRSLTIPFPRSKEIFGAHIVGLSVVSRIQKIHQYTRMDSAGLN